MLVLGAILLAAFHLGAFVDAAPTPGGPDFAALEREIDALRTTCGGIRGASVAVEWNGTEWTKGFGYKDDGDVEENKVTEDTLFLIGSVTKSFTSLLVAHAISQGKLAWNAALKDSVPAFWPGYPGFNNTFADTEATIVDLLSHQTGIPRHDGLVALWDNPEQILARIKYLQPSSSFRSTWYYNNHMYNLAGTIAAKSMGTNWQDYVRETIFNRLEMRSSLPSVAEFMNAKDRARGYFNNATKGEADAYELIFDAAAPAGAISSSAKDMQKYMRALLQMMEGDGAVNVRREDVWQIFKPHKTIEESGGPLGFSKENGFQSYGLGWFISNSRGNTRFFHGGNTLTFTSNLCIIPYAGLGVTILTNRAGAEGGTCFAETVCDKIIHRLLYPNEPEEETKRAPTPTPPAPPQVDFKPVARDIHQYEGLYTSPAYGRALIAPLPVPENATEPVLNVTIGNRQNHPMFSNMTIPLYSLGNDVFMQGASMMSDGSDARVTFRLEGDKVVGLWMVLDPELREINCKKYGCAEYFGRS